MKARRTRPCRTSSPSTKLRRVGGDRKADALRAHDHRGVDADDLAARGDQRAARIAGIERGVGLDDVVDQAARSRAQRAAERRHDAGRHRRFEAERIADGDHELAALEQLGVAERRRRQRQRASTRNERKIGIGIVADHARLEPPAVDRADTRRCAAPPTTWLLVSTRPSGATTTPEPEPPRRAAVPAHRAAPRPGRRAPPHR